MKLRYKPSVYTSLSLAQASLDHMVKACWVIVKAPDANQYLVVCFSDAAKMFELGYEIVPNGVTEATIPDNLKCGVDSELKAFLGM